MGRFDLYIGFFLYGFVLVCIKVYFGIRLKIDIEYMNLRNGLDIFGVFGVFFNELVWGS